MILTKQRDWDIINMQPLCHDISLRLCSIIFISSWRRHGIHGVDSQCGSATR